MKRTVLFPTDFSKRASQALNEAIHFAEMFDCQLLIYHAYHRPVGEYESKTSLEKLEEKIDASFKRLESTHPDLSKISYEFRKDLGVSIDLIVKTAKTANIDLIIMATKGAKGFGELWGTKTARIVKSVDIPVLTIPDNSSLKELKKICLACDYSVQSDYDQLKLLVELAEALNLSVDVITLNRDEKNMIRKELDHRERIRKDLERVETSFEFTFHEFVEEGIIEYSLEKGIGLIAILPKSYSFLEHIFHESLTEKMTFHSPIPLLVLN